MKNFLKTLMGRIAPTVFKPIPEGLLYIFLQSISREFSGECPWDTSDRCFKHYDSYWSVKCRNSLCPGYRHPLGVVAYTSESDPLSNVDDRFDYSSFRQVTLNDYMPVGSLGVQIKFDFGKSDLGGFGAGYFGALYFGDNSLIEPASDIRIGDKWTIACTAQPRGVGPAVRDSANKGSYGPISVIGPYTGNHDTTYTVQIIDFWGYVQNFNNALLQMCLATCDGQWVDFWGSYFGITRMLQIGGYEKDEDYKARILKEITRAKGTKAVLLEAAQDFYKSTAVRIVEYCQEDGWDGVNTGKDPEGNADTDYAGLQPFQFYIYPPIAASPNIKFVKDGSKFTVNGIGRVWTANATYYGVSGYGYGEFQELLNIGVVDSVGDALFFGDIGDAVVYGNPSKFSGISFEFLTPGVGGSYVWEYWNGYSWATLTVTDLTEGLTQDGGVWWKLPSNWKASDAVPYNIPQTGALQYWVRCRVVDVPSVTSIAELIELHYAGATNRGHYVGYVGNEVADSNAYNPVKRDKNDCYIYALDSWLRPSWEFGLQAIIDRLKTAGTIAIINPA